jgi:hypothetical protein
VNIEGLLKLVELIEKWQAASLTNEEEGFVCQNALFPPVCRDREHLPVVETSNSQPPTVAVAAQSDGGTSINSSSRGEES